MRDHPPVTIRLVYLARLREAFGASDESFRITEAGGDTVAALLDSLRLRGGAYAHELGHGRAVRVAVNHAIANPGDRLHEGDEVALLPPVTGG